MPCCIHTNAVVKFVPLCGDVVCEAVPADKTGARPIVTEPAALVGILVMYAREASGTEVHALACMECSGATLQCSCDVSWHTRSSPGMHVFLQDSAK
jgi:hypothetical protein